MGRGSSKASGGPGGGGGGNALLDSLTDNLDFRAWIRENLKNPDFKKFGQENGMEDVKQLWYEKRAAEELKGLHELSREEAIQTIRDNVDPNTISGWFRNGNSDYKPKLVDQIMAHPGTLNAGLNIAYQNYKDDMSDKGKAPQPFNKWVVTPQTIYRGERGQQDVKSDIFKAYTPDIDVAARFTVSDSGQALVKAKDVDKSKIKTAKVRPIDTWGSYQTTGEQEYLVPIKKKRSK